jgi:hypothetical protein
MHPIIQAPAGVMTSEDARRCASRQVRLSLGLVGVTIAGMVMAGSGLFGTRAGTTRPQPRLEIAIEPPIAEPLRPGYPDLQATVLTRLQ